MFHTMSVDTWTIYSTLWTGMTLGMCIVITAAYLAFRADRKLPKDVAVTSLPANLQIVKTQDQVYDHTKNRHIA